MSGRGAGDRFDARLVQERPAGHRERGEELPVAGDRLVEEQRPVGEAAHLEVGVAGEGLEPAPHEPAEARLGARQELCQLRDRLQRESTLREESPRARLVRFAQRRVAHRRGGLGLGKRRRAALLRQQQLRRDAPERHVPAVLARREGAQLRVPGPQHRLAGEEAQVHHLPADPVLEVPDARRPRLRAPAHREHAARALLEEPAGMGHDVGLEEAEVPEDPARQSRADPAAGDLHRVRAVERVDDRGEGPLDLLAPVRALRRQLALRVEVAVEEGEAHHPLGGRHVAVDRGHELREVGLLALGRGAGDGGVVPVGHDQQGVVVAPVAHEESPLHARHVGQPPLDGRRRDRLAAGVLVHVLHAVDDLEVAAGPAHEDVAGREPAHLARLRRGVVEVVGHVGPGDLQLPDRGQPRLDPGQRHAHRAVLVLPRGRHRDPAGALGHPEPAAQLDPVPLEVAEHRRVEVPGGGEPPAQPVPGDRAQRLVPLARAPGSARAAAPSGAGCRRGRWAAPRAGRVPACRRTGCRRRRTCRPRTASPSSRGSGRTCGRAAGSTAAPRPRPPPAAPPRGRSAS